MSRAFFRQLVVGLGIAISISAHAESACNKLEDSDLETCSLEASTGVFSAENFAIRAPLSKFRLGIVRAQDIGESRSTVRAMALSSKASACINANFFDNRGMPLGLVVTGGRTYQKAHKSGRVLTGILAITRQGPEIMHRDLYTEKDTLEGTQAGPRLLEKGVITSGLKQGSAYSRRSAICLDASNNIIFVTSGAGLRGTQLNDLADILKTPPLNCVDALNLDGGGSAQLFVSTPEEADNIYIQGSDEVPVALCLFKKGFW